MTQIGVQVDAGEVERMLKGFRKQIPFSIATALNALANSAQTHIRDSLASRFTLRRPDFVKRAIKREKATDFASKTKLEAIVRVDSNAGWLAQHEEGGIKRPREGKALAIPTIHVRRTKTEIIRSTERPRSLLRSKSAQAGRVYTSHGLILRTRGRGKNAVTVPLYGFVAQARIVPRLGFHKTAQATADREWYQHASKAVDRAIATAKP